MDEVLLSALKIWLELIAHSRQLLQTTWTFISFLAKGWIITSSICRFKNRCRLFYFYSGDLTFIGWTRPHWNYWIWICIAFDDSIWNSFSDGNFDWICFSESSHFMTNSTRSGRDRISDLILYCSKSSPCNR